MREQSSVVQRALNDQPFYGNGARWQNVFGHRARWWQFSYDTSKASGRAGQAFMRLAVTVGAVWFLVLLLIHAQI